jgi:hypothetical protein
VNDLWEKVQSQQAALCKLQRKYETIKGDLLKRQAEFVAVEEELRLLREVALVATNTNRND